MGSKNSKSEDSNEAKLAEDAKEKYAGVNHFTGVLYRITSSGNVSINANGSTVSSSLEPQTSPWSDKRSTQRDDNNGHHAIDYGQIERPNEGEMIQPREPSFFSDQSQQRYSHSTRYPAMNRTI
ncbi:hypothetical protein GCK72_007366 [Caenorhabditis remanei]|uniref:Uncharacterized protein n=1 Tax=Caenorhabditis remanei TaxID=31234 RepID=A0A6A5HLS6_CAERE|nr:hypothetical protein GCK72_007366 [Caenorhabditis remanei]KAF1767407.1 hypothetical protein GCK72_007366 [Caenorhabditis remanei]